MRPGIELVQILAPRLVAAVVILAIVASACSSAATPSTTPQGDSVAGVASSTTSSEAISTTVTTLVPTSTSTTDLGVSSNRYTLGAFPDYPEGPLPASVATALQSLLDTAVETGSVRGVTAAVIVAEKGTWTGTAGTWDGVAITPESRHPTHSSAKTMVAAEMLRLVEDGRVGLDDLATDHLPRELAFFDANGATIREVLGMRSGLPSLDDVDAYYVAELAPTPLALFTALPAPVAPPGSVTRYSGTNYVLLGSIIEHITGRPLAEVLHGDVLAHPGLDGIVHTVPDAMASDGWGVETTSAALARWGYDLFGGSVISTTSLHAMTDFNGEWYGFGVMNYPLASGGVFTGSAVGHQGLSSVTTCCSAVALVALPDQGIVIAVQADTTPAYDTANPRVDRLARTLAEAFR